MSKFSSAILEILNELVARFVVLCDPGGKDLKDLQHAETSVHRDERTRGEEHAEERRRRARRAGESMAESTAAESTAAESTAAESTAESETAERTESTAARRHHASRAQRENGATVSGLQTGHDYGTSHAKVHCIARTRSSMHRGAHR